VGIFQPYKHWHIEAVHSFIRNLELDYSLRSFMRDLSKIRGQTFKELTITHAFEKAGIWPVNYSRALLKLWKYSKPSSNELVLPVELSSFKDSKAQLQQWKAKLLVLISSPSRQRYKDWLKGTEEALATGQLQELDLMILKRRVEEQKNKAVNSRLHLQTGGAVTVEEAWAIQTSKTARETQKQLSKEARAARTAASQIKKQLHRAGVEARKQERLRKKRVTALQKAGQPIPSKDRNPIPDPEAEAQDEESQSETGSGDGVGFGSDDRGYEL
jgi:hypothetical protein